MVNFWKIVNSVIEESDLILEVVDSRMPKFSRNEEIEKKIEKQNKKLIIVLNKCDLVEKDDLDKMKKKLKNSVFVSTKKMLGTTILKKKILSLGAKEKIVVGVVGFPNTGKSSIINAIAGKNKAKASSYAGFTKGIQKIRASSRIMLLDTPGVIPFKENDESRETIIAAKNPAQLDDPEYIALEIIKLTDEKSILKTYNIEYNFTDEIDDDILEKIAIKKNLLKKGGLANTKDASIIVIKDWQTGKLKPKLEDLEKQLID
ncbi:MAG: GTPase [Candidatus Woesearchaeota archaeon]